MRLFDTYLSGLEDVLSKKTTVTPGMLQEQQKQFSKSIQNSINADLQKEEGVPKKIEGPKVIFTYDPAFIDKHFGKNPHSFENITIGTHPDFLDLQETSKYVNHHCVSVFIDIKGSTRLIEKYSLLEVRLIKDSLLTLAIQVANQYGGHVHRLQGDGIFLQFVRRNKNKNDAIINALNAASILTQFVSIDLAKIFKEYDIKPLKIRTGIDFGDTDKVLWSYYGIPGCGEFTTTSLHTDMAAKLQNKAFDNSILIGGNVQKELDLKNEFCLIYETYEKREKVYYISQQYSYSFFVFDWKTYLLSFPFISKMSDGDTLEIKEKDYTIDCFICNEDGTELEKYYPNSRSIPKGKKIKYQLKFKNINYVLKSFEKIEWHAYNSGKEAENKSQMKHDFEKKFHNKSNCETTAAFLGHHFVECKIIRQHSSTEKYTFPIFVQ